VLTEVESREAEPRYPLVYRFLLGLLEQDHLDGRLLGRFLVRRGDPGTDDNGVELQLSETRGKTSFERGTSRDRLSPGVGDINKTVD
jgi:hypothetical protein